MQSGSQFGPVGLGKPSWPLRYGLAVGTALIGVLAQVLLRPLWGEPASLLLGVPAVILSAQYGGFGPGLLAAGIGGLWAAWLLRSPLNPLGLGTADSLLSVGLFLAIGAYISWHCRRQGPAAAVARTAALSAQPCPSKASTDYLTPGDRPSLTNNQGGSAITFNQPERRDGGWQDTERQQTELQLKQSLKDLSDMQLALNQAAIVAITDERGAILYANSKFCEISQYTQEELIGQDHRILNSGYHPKAFFHDLWSTIQSGQTWTGEIKNRTKDGCYYWVSTTIVPFLDEQGRPKRYMAIRFDITPQKQAEADLQQLNGTLESQVKERTAQLQQSLSFGATLKRITDKVRDSLDERQILQTAVQELGQGLGVRCCNAALYNLEQGTSTICYEYNTSLFSTQGRVAKLNDYPEIYQPLLRGEYRQFCNVIANPIRGRVTMLACPIRDDQGVLGDLWLVNDKEYAFREQELRLVEQVASQCAIALRQAHLYNEAQAQVKALEQLNWLKDDFLSTVSHELRTPVSNIKMSIRMLEIVLNQAANSVEVPERALQYLQILKNECDREISLINDLLDLQRLEAGKRSLAFDRLDIADWLLQLVHPFEERARTRQQTLRVRLPDQALPPLVSDGSALERVLSELLNNACKYTPPGETISLSVEPLPDKIRFLVSNSGTEISADEQARIFDKFYRVPNGDPWKQGGTGLGLALVDKLAQHLGGSVKVDSGANQTTFIVEVANYTASYSAESVGRD